jgi:ubiquitin C-terminal hydrolase
VRRWASKSPTGKFNRSDLGCDRSLAQRAATLPHQDSLTFGLQGPCPKDLPVLQGAQVAGQAAAHRRHNSRSMAAEELAADWAGPESWPDSGVENQFGIDGSGDGGMFGVLAPQSSAGSEGEFVMLHLTCNIPPPGQPRTGTVRCALGKTVGDLRAMIASTLEIESAFDIEGSSDITSVSTTVYLRDLDLADQTALDITNARPIAPEHSPPSTPRGDVSEEDPPSPRINRSAVAGQTVSTGITTTSYGTSYGSSWNSKSNTGFVGLSNQGATCYLNSLIQGLYMTFELRKAIYQWEYDPTKYEAVDECVPAQLQRLFVALQTSDERAVETEGLTKAFGWTDSDAFEQQDVNEMLVLLFDALEVKFKGTPQAGLIRALYQGEYQDYVQCRECGHKAGAGRQPFQASDINIAIREFGCTTPISSIEEGLAKYFKSELLDGDNQYECEKCAKKVDADKGLQLTKVPYVLCLGMKRFEYDWERDARCKVDDRVTFPRTLDMAQFLAPDEGDAGAEAVPPDDAGETTSPRSADAAAQEEALRRSVSFGKNNTPLEAANAQTVIEHGGSLPYELFAVLIHSGSAIGGHYYSYLKSGGPDGTWYEFNDSSISAIDDDDLEKAFGGARPQIPYIGLSILYWAVWCISRCIHDARWARFLLLFLHIVCVCLHADVPPHGLALEHQRAQPQRFASQAERRDGG